METWNSEGAKKVLILSSSPRLEGNSRSLAVSFAAGAREAGHEVVVVDLVRHVRHMLGYCRTCRDGDGECSLDDDFKPLFLRLYLAADAVVFATPIWWYGMSSHMKNFIDRMSCYISESSPHGAQAKLRVMGKRVALLLSAEESSFASRLGLVSQVAEFCRHVRCSFVGVVTGLGNLHGEVARDPTNPLEEARLMGQRLFDLEDTDYELDTPRSVVVWPDGSGRFPSYWR